MSHIESDTNEQYVSAIREIWQSSFHKAGFRNKQDSHTLKSHEMWDGETCKRITTMCQTQKDKMQLQRFPVIKHRLKATYQSMKGTVVCLPGRLYLTALYYKLFLLFCLPLWKNKSMAKTWTRLCNTFVMPEAPLGALSECMSAFMGHHFWQGGGTLSVYWETS